MLPSKRRLWRGTKFGPALRAAKSGRFIIYDTANGLSRGRIGVTVGVKTEKNASGRNKLRRRVYEILANLPERSGRDALVVVLPDAKSRKFKELAEELTQMFKKIQQ